MHKLHRDNAELVREGNWKKGEGELYKVSQDRELLQNWLVKLLGHSSHFKFFFFSQQIFENQTSRCVTKMLLLLSLTTDPVCAKPVSQEMMLPGLSSHPLLDALATRYENQNITKNIKHFSNKSYIKFEILRRQIKTLLRK